MAVQKAEAVALGYTPKTTETNTFNIDISKVNPFGGRDAQKANEKAAQTQSGKLLFGAGLVKESARKEQAELPAARRQNMLGVLSNYFKHIGSTVTEYDNAVKIVNQYMPNRYDTLAAIESNPRIAAIIRTNPQYCAYLQNNS